VGVRDNSDVWVVVPVYNEASVIGQVIADLHASFPNVVCVDDGSWDQSAAIIADSGAHLVRHAINLGQGAALQTGLHYARSRSGSMYFVTFDADGQHRVADAVEMVEAVRRSEADVILGSRFVTSDVPRLRRLALLTATRLSPASRLLGLTDTHNGLRVLNRAAAEHLRIRQNGMAHASEIVAELAASSLRVKEMPVTILYTQYSRAKGQSLFNGVNILADLLLARKDHG
jgi:glycosyltransferase involved in cell wall biosynthesis